MCNLLLNVIQYADFISVVGRLLVQFTASFFESNAWVFHLVVNGIPANTEDFRRLSERFRKCRRCSDNERALPMLFKRWQLTTPEIPWHTIMLFVCYPIILHRHYLQFLSGIKVALRETENNAYAKFWVDKQRALWCVMVFSGVVNFSVFRFCKDKKSSFNAFLEDFRGN